MDMMKQRLYIVCLLCLCVVAHAWGQETDAGACAMHENVLSVEYGGIWQNDEYLSPLLYSGRMIGLQHEWWTGFGQREKDKEQKTEDWSHVGKIHIVGAKTDNGRVIRNQQWAFGVNGGWGAQYDFRRLIDIEGLNVWVGPYAHVDFMARLIGSYENKPYSMDIGATVRAHAGISYVMRGKRSAYRLQYAIMTDVLGAQFAPDYWQSYYEMTQTLDGTVVLASLHNRQSLWHELSVDMQFHRSTWRVGVRHEYTQYHANNLHFSREQVSVVVGTVFNHRISKTPLK